MFIWDFGFQDLRVPAIDVGGEDIMDGEKGRDLRRSSGKRHLRALSGHIAPSLSGTLDLFGLYPFVSQNTPLLVTSLILKNNGLFFFFGSFGDEEMT